MVGLALTKRPQSRAQTAITRTVPAPVGGVNARDAIAAMPPTDAVILDNWFCYPSYVAVRNGSSLWASGLPGAVESVMAYTATAGVAANAIWGVSQNSFFNCTAQGVVGAAIVTGLGSSQWQHGMFNSGGGNVLLAVDGVDSPLRYDGKTQGGVELLMSLVPGSGYVNNTYTAVPLTGGTGTGAQATIVVSGAAVTSVTISAPGSAYVVGDTLSASNTHLGGSGSGFSIKVQTIGGWSTTTIAGTNSITGLPLAPANLITVTVHQQRVWYIEANTMNVWYSLAQAYQGTLTCLPLGQLFARGGYLVQMASWAVDNVAGINAFGAFITSEGEVAIYQGYDPSSASTWSFVGIFKIGRPIGRRCICKYGSDVLCITADGLTPLSKALLTDRTQGEAAELTYKIMNAINTDVQNYAGNFGWQVVIHPIGNKLLLNVPEVTDTTAHQWVKNIVRQDDGGWSRFVGWNANCLEVQTDTLYYGGNQAVYVADTGQSDAGMPITVDALPAYSIMEMPGVLKNFEFVRPIFLTSTAVQPVITVNIDYQNLPTSNPLLLTTGGSAPWDTSPWDITPWGDIIPSITVKAWQGASGFGYAASGRITMQISGIVCQWYQTDYVFQAGGPI